LRRQTNRRPRWGRLIRAEEERDELGADPARDVYRAPVRGELGEPVECAAVREHDRRAAWWRGP
jgi:hypothetical protein